MSIVWQRIKPPREFHGRISTDKNDAGYQSLVNLGGPSSNIRVILNGIECQGHCTMADSIEGIVVRYKLDNRGSPHVIGDELVTETVSGNVRILIEQSSA